MTGGFSRHPFVREALGALDELVAGARSEGLETPTLDFKEEAGRRDRQGAHRSGSPNNEPAAKALAEEAACLANSQGGVLVVGVRDDAVGQEALVGAELDCEWLRERIWALTEPRLAVDIEAHHLAGTRLLIVLVQPSFRLHRSAKKFKHRVGSSCVEMSAEDQRRTEEERSGYDWSAEPSSFTADDASEAAVDLAREYLGASEETGRLELADRPTPDLLRRLGVLGTDGSLSNAGAVMFVAADEVAIDFKRRHVPGGSSVDRVEEQLPMLQAYDRVKKSIDATNEVRELQLESGVRPRIRLIPDLAVREALVNAVIHRDYRHAEPIDVEFVGTQLIVTSPGGFPPGITEQNIISERSHPRNRALTQVFRSLRLAEQEGVGVDRMFRDMVSVGLSTPVIADRGGRVRCLLVGGEPEEAVVKLIASLPAGAQDDVDIALSLHVLLERANVSAGELVDVLQKLEPECAAALRRGEQTGVLQKVSWSTRTKPRWRLADNARAQLRNLLPYLTASASEAEEFVLRHLLTHDEIRPRDVTDMLNVSEVQGSRILRELRESDVLRIGSEHDRGRGVFHVRGARFAEAIARHGI